MPRDGIARFTQMRLAHAGAQREQRPARRMIGAVDQEIPAVAARFIADRLAMQREAQKQIGAAAGAVEAPAGAAPVWGQVTPQPEAAIENH